MNKTVLIFSLAASLCFFQTIAAQSGRRPKAGDISSKPSAASETTLDAPADAKSPDKITSLVILGQSGDKGFLYSGSNYLDVAIKECLYELNERAAKSGLNVVKGGKAKFEDAVKAAKTELATHVLWLDLQTKIDGQGNEAVDYIDYAVLAPQTAKRLTYGRVQPEQSGIVGQGVPRIPTVPAARRAPVNSQIKASSRQIIDRLIYWKWL